jgi:hypothetical protein
MKKVRTKSAQNKVKEMRAEYDFSAGVRGKHHRAIQKGYTITIHKANGRTEVREVSPPAGTVILEPDVRTHFPDSRSVNRALRSLIRFTPTRQVASPRKRGT